MTSGNVPDRVTMLDAVSIALVVAGALCATLTSLPPRSQLAQATPLLFGFALTVRVIVDRQAAGRGETVRTIKPKGKRLGSAALLGAVIVPLLYFSTVPGHGWLALGYLFVGIGISASSLVESRKTDQEDPVVDDS